MRTIVFLLAWAGVAAADKGDARRVTGIASDGRSYSINGDTVCTSDNVCRPGRATGMTLPPSTLTPTINGRAVAITKGKGKRSATLDPRVPEADRCGAARDVVEELAAVAIVDNDMRALHLHPGSHLVRIHNAYAMGTTLVIEYSTERNAPIKPPATSCGRVERVMAFDVSSIVK
jgi:hypothetical protein